MVKELILLFFGALLGIGGTLFVQWINNNQIKETLHKKLFEEIKFNQTQGSITERTGRFVEFRTEVWESFVGTPAFYDVPIDTRKALDTYYFMIKGFNKNMFKWTKLENKGENEMTMDEMKRLTEDYAFFLLKSKILRPNREFKID